MYEHVFNVHEERISAPKYLIEIKGRCCNRAVVVTAVAKRRREGLVRADVRAKIDIVLVDPAGGWTQAGHERSA